MSLRVKPETLPLLQSRNENKHILNHQREKKDWVIDPLLFSCNNQTRNKEGTNKQSQNRILCSVSLPFDILRSGDTLLHDRDTDTDGGQGDTVAIFCLQGCSCALHRYSIRSCDLSWSMWHVQAQLTTWKLKYTRAKYKIKCHLSLGFNSFLDFAPKGSEIYQSRVYLVQNSCGWRNNKRTDCNNFNFFLEQSFKF